MTEHPNLAAALAAFQSAMPVVHKSKRANTGSYAYTYADLASIVAAVAPVLAEHGLAYAGTTRHIEGGRYELVGILSHASGEQREGALPIPNGNPQQVGSAITYMRRYLLGVMTGVVTDDDDDGAAASAPKRQASRRPTVSGPVESADNPPAGKAPGPESDRITVPQQKNLRRLLADYGLGSKESRDEVLALASSVLGRDIATSSDLSRAEASRLIDHLAKQLGELPGPEDPS